MPGRSSRPARIVASRNGISYRCVALHGRQKRRYGSPIIDASAADTSPLSIGLTTISRIAAAIASNASRLPMPAALSGLDAS